MKPKLTCLLCDGDIGYGWGCDTCNVRHYHNAPSSSDYIEQSELFVEMNIGTYSVQGNRKNVNIFVGYRVGYNKGARSKYRDLDIRLFVGVDQTLMNTLWDNDQFDKLKLVKPLL